MAIYRSQPEQAGTKQVLLAQSIKNLHEAYSNTMGQLGSKYCNFFVTMSSKLTHKGIKIDR